jgi:hypothetical protein
MNKFEVRFDRVTRTIITDILVRRTTKPSSFRIDAPVVDIPIRALWDTGAYMSVISARLAFQLGLTSVDQRAISGIGGTILSKRYYLSIILPNKLIFPSIRAAEWNGHQFYDMLSGWTSSVRAISPLPMARGKLSLPLRRRKRG